MDKEQKLRVFRLLYLGLLNLGIVCILYALLLIMYNLPLLIASNPSWIDYFVVVWFLGGFYILLAIAGDYLAYKGKLFKKREA